MPRLSASRRCFGALALALSLAGPALTPGSAAAQPAAARHADPSAESFVQNEAGRVLAILNNPSLGAAAKKRAIYDFVNRVADVPRITGFVLGRYRRTITPEQYAAFARAFRAYADSVYEKRLSDYHGEGLRVTGSVVRQPGDVVVSSQITGGQFKNRPSVVNWRVIRGQDGRWRVVDVQAEGVWLAVVEQQDFTSTLANAGGDIDVLTRQLQQDVARGVLERGDSR